MLQNVAIQWLVRRIPEWGGIVVTLITFYNSMPAEHRQFIGDVLQGQGGGLTIGAAIGFALWVYAQVISFRSTVKPQAVVEENGKLVTNTLAPKKEKEVADVVTNVSSRKSLFDILLGK